MILPTGLSFHLGPNIPRGGGGGPGTGADAHTGESSVRSIDMRDESGIVRFEAVGWAGQRIA